MKRISRREVVQGAAAAITLGAPPVSTLREERQTLRFVAQAGLKVLDPVWSTAYITRNHGYLVYEPSSARTRTTSNRRWSSGPPCLQTA